MHLPRCKGHAWAVHNIHGKQINVCSIQSPVSDAPQDMVPLFQSLSPSPTKLLGEQEALAAPVLHSEHDKTTLVLCHRQAGVLGRPARVAVDAAELGLVCGGGVDEAEGAGALGEVRACGKQRMRVGERTFAGALCVPQAF